MSDKDPPPPRRTLPTTARGRPMDVPPGTGFGITALESGTRYLMSDADAAKAENIITLFEQLKGRPATNEERAGGAQAKSALALRHQFVFGLNLL